VAGVVASQPVEGGRGGEAEAHVRDDIGKPALDAPVAWIGRTRRDGASVGADHGDRADREASDRLAELVAAGRHPDGVAAVVSRGGRPDLAEGWLALVQAPTLLVVGALDTTVIELNQVAYDQLRVERAIEIVPGATHLFEEPGALEHVARLAGDWFARYLTTSPGDEAVD